MEIKHGIVLSFSNCSIEDLGWKYIFQHLTFLIKHILYFLYSLGNPLNFESVEMQLFCPTLSNIITVQLIFMFDCSDYSFSSNIKPYLRQWTTFPCFWLVSSLIVNVGSKLLFLWEKIVFGLYLISNSILFYVTVSPLVNKVGFIIDTIK